VTVPDDDVDRLYDLGADEFVGARDRLAAQLRRDGDRPAAETVRKLRRPTIVAWALNQLVRRHPDLVDQLLVHGRAAAAAQREVLAGDDATAFRDADRRRRAAVSELLDAAGALGSAHLDEIEASLQAASLDPDGAGAQLRQGRLSAAIPPAAGFDLALAGWSADVPARPRRPGGPVAGDQGPDHDDDVTQAAERARRNEARRRARELSRAAEEAEAQLRDLERDLSRLQARVDEARRQAAEARRRADAAGDS
jgi:hypothetical protein